MSDEVEIRESLDLPMQAVLDLYRANHWSSAEKPNELYHALRNSHAVVTAWDADVLVGLANAISDGHLVVYYPHVVVHPEYHRRGIGLKMMKQLMQHYEGFHQQSILADKDAVAFFKSCGFQRAGQTEPMWIFGGDEH